MTLQIRRKNNLKPAEFIDGNDSSSLDGARLGRNGKEAGFSLVEVAIALIIVLVALLGVFATFTYAINYNAGNNVRAQALAVLQQEVELMRSAKFTPYVSDPPLDGGTHAAKTVTSADGRKFLVNVVIDNDPETTAVEDEIAKPKPTLKQITIKVTPEISTTGWQTAVPATIVMRRVRAN